MSKRTRRSRRGMTALAVAVAVALVGCESSGQTYTTPPIPTNPPATAPPSTSTSATSTSSGSTIAVATTSAATTTSAVTSSSVAVTSAPTTTVGGSTVETRVPTAALPLDPADLNNQHTVTPEQQPIIDAYRAVIEAELLTDSVWPLDPRSPELLAAPMTAEFLAGEAPGLVERTQLHEVLDISGGITLRPYIVETEDPTRVFVYDCQIDATFWKNRDTGAKAPSDANWPNAGAPGVKWGIVVVFVKVDGRWLASDGGIDASACL